MPQARAPSHSLGQSLPNKTTHGRHSFRRIRIGIEYHPLYLRRLCQALRNVTSPLSLVTRKRSRRHHRQQFGLAPRYPQCQIVILSLGSIRDSRSSTNGRLAVTLLLAYHEGRRRYPSEKVGNVDWRRLIICPAPFTVATVNDPEDLVSPAFLPPTVQSRHELAKYSICPLHSRRSIQSLLALALHCQSYVPR